MIVEVIGGLLIVALNNFPDQSGVFKQIPVAESIEFSAGGDDVCSGDCFKPLAFFLTVCLQAFCKIKVFSAHQGFIKAANGFKISSATPEQPPGNPVNQEKRFRFTANLKPRTLNLKPSTLQPDPFTPWGLHRKIEVWPNRSR